MSGGRDGRDIGTHWGDCWKVHEACATSRKTLAAQSCTCHLCPPGIGCAPCWARETLTCPTPGDCQPSCSPECFKQKLKSMQFLLPGPFRAQRGKTDG